MTLDAHAAADALVGQGLAHDALLDHVQRGDARHALGTLVGALARQLGGPCTLRAEHANGQLRWQCEATAGIAAAAPSAVAAAPGAAQSFELSCLGQRVGTLCVHGAAPSAALLDPVRSAAAALLFNDAAAARSAAQPGALELARVALHGSGAHAWEWDIDSDVLGDIDEALLQLGFAAGEIGRTRADWDRLIHPDDRAANHEAYLRHARGEVAQYEHSYRVRDKAGQWRWFQARGRIVEWHDDGRPRRMLGTQTDISAQREREHAAAQLTARLERIAQHVPGVLYEFELGADRVPRFAYLSERAHAMLGVDIARAAVDAGDLLERIDGADRAALRAGLLASARALTPWQCEFRLQLAPHGVRWLRASASPTRRADGGTRWHGYLQDVTDLRELERARQDTAAAEAAHRAQADFLSRMSHELRTPLNAVLGFAQLLEIDRADRLSEGQRRRVGLIREAGEQLLRMIDDLFDRTRIGLPRS